MKDIKKYYQYYQDLIKDINLYNGKIVSGLNNHITWLESKVFKLQEELEKKNERADLQKEIDEYNRLETQKSTGLENEIAQLKAKLSEKESDLKSAYDTIEAWETRFYTLVTEYGIDLNRPVKKESVEKAKTRKRSKTVVACCKDCGTYFQAKSTNAKYCSACGKERAKQSRLKWLAKQAKKK